MNQRIVCAALRHRNGAIICGPRHFDGIMAAQVRISVSSENIKWTSAEQGFVDQRCNFLIREEAYVVAKRNGQIIRRCGGDDGKLFSENLY